MVHLGTYIFLASDMALHDIWVCRHCECVYVPLPEWR